MFSIHLKIGRLTPLYCAWCWCWISQFYWYKREVYLTSSTGKRATENTNSALNKWSVSIINTNQTQSQIFAYFMSYHRFGWCRHHPTLSPHAVLSCSVKRANAAHYFASRWRHHARRSPHQLICGRAGFLGLTGLEIRLVHFDHWLLRSKSTK